MSVAHQPSRSPRDQAALEKMQALIERHYPGSTQAPYGVPTLGGPNA